MAKNHSTVFSLAGVDPTVEITKHTNKKGKLIASNKKEKKALRSICEHQIINHKGKTKVRIEDAGSKNGQDYLRCPICGDYYKAGFYTDEEYDKAYRGFKPILAQAKMLAPALGADKRTRQQIGETNLYVDNFGKVYKNMRKVAEKKDKVKNKKKKKRNTSSLGGWEAIR